MVFSLKNLLDFRQIAMRQGPIILLLIMGKRKNGELCPRLYRSEPGAELVAV
jgi:hypothetical protein